MEEGDLTRGSSSSMKIIGIIIGIIVIIGIIIGIVIMTGSDNSDSSSTTSSSSSGSSSSSSSGGSSSSTIPPSTCEEVISASSVESITGITNIEVTDGGYSNIFDGIECDYDGNHPNCASSFCLANLGIIVECGTSETYRQNEITGYRDSATMSSMNMELLEEPSGIGDYAAIIHHTSFDSYTLKFHKDDCSVSIIMNYDDAENPETMLKSLGSEVESNI